VAHSKKSQQAIASPKKDLGCEFEGIFSPVCGVARGYQCPVFAEGKLASRVKDKFVKEWGPAAKLQVQRDKEISKETSENVQQMNDLFVAYNLFCTDDAEKKQQAKESYDETKGQMDAYENDLGAQPPDPPIKPFGRLYVRIFSPCIPFHLL
jgi:hypothetical protein